MAFYSVICLFLLCKKISELGDSSHIVEKQLIAEQLRRMKTYPFFDSQRR